MKHEMRIFLVLMFTSSILPSVAAAQDAAAGNAVYDSRCVICHGDQGDGLGLIGIVHRAQQSGVVVTIYPRDFTAGVFKFRSTPTGTLPTDDDLFRTITEGISRSGMPSHTDLSETDRLDVIAYIKTFSPRWEQDEPGEPFTIDAAPSYVGSADSTEQGVTVYQTMRCATCHGETGLGDGPSSAELEDSWGDRILPFDFTSGPLKGGSTPEMIYRTFMTGLDGTPMPSYEPAMPIEEERWHLVSYILRLMTGETDAQDN
ncbi:MAG TPA: c-type cytochrome [Vicinamibacterales bacterium]|jgi:cytochrome c2|nr:c-type cytochrome [Vicinamibacterales bacterium]|tara:strand:- start:624 stop:1400 length:777 start_codon:yes stop_codon:yes gene_type:complete